MTESVHPRKLRPESPSGSLQQAAHGDFDTAADTAVTVTLADPGNFHVNVIDGVVWSYSAAPTGGKLQIKEGTTVLLEVDVTAAGPGQLQLPGFHGAASEALSVVLAAGGGAVVGKVTLITPRIEIIG